MKIVVEEACKGAPEEVLSWAVSSFDSMFVHWLDDGGNLKEKRMVGTLPSGHRATSFINTILNAAYLMHVAQPHGAICRHTGDDIIISAHPDECERILRLCAGSSLRMNPSKQSIGPRGEFLRINIADSRAQGYTARAVSTLVSGNWVTESSGSQVSYLNGLLGGIWNVCIRSGTWFFGLLLRKSLERSIPKLSFAAMDLLTFKVSFNGSPVRSQGMNRVGIIRLEEKISRTKSNRHRFSHATQDFITKFVDPNLLDRFGVKLGSLKAMMVKSSYKPDTSYIMGTPDFELSALPQHLAANCWRPLTSVQDGLSKLLKGWSSVPEQLAVLRLAVKSRLEVATLLPTERWPAVNIGNLPWSVLSNISSTLSVPVYVTSSYGLYK
jgi:hypothetical protein